MSVGARWAAGVRRPGFLVMMLGATGCGGDEAPQRHPPSTNPELDLYSAPGVPHPDALEDVRLACQAMLDHERDVCGTEPDASELESCVDEWRDVDSRGCSAAYQKYIECRTERDACEESDEENCGLYTDAAFLCTTDFVQRTRCAPVHVTEVCDADAAYVYACSGDRSPFPECKRADIDGNSIFCCY